MNDHSADEVEDVRPGMGWKKARGILKDVRPGVPAEQHIREARDAMWGAVSGDIFDQGYAEGRREMIQDLIVEIEAAEASSNGFPTTDVEAIATHWGKFIVAWLSERLEREQPPDPPAR